MAKGIAHREWLLNRSDYRNQHGEIDDDLFREAVERESVLNVHIQERLGVAIVSAPVRTRDLPDGAYFTVGWVFRTATVPAATEDTPADLPADAEMPDLAGVGMSE